MAFASRGISVAAKNLHFGLVRELLGQIFHRPQQMGAAVLQ
jgi:hypothetical protein